METTIVYRGCSELWVSEHCISCLSLLGTGPETSPLGPVNTCWVRRRFGEQDVARKVQ